MQDLNQLLEDIVAMLKSCPLIVDEAGGEQNIWPYLDLGTSDTNSLTRSIYIQPPGVLVAWQTSGLETGAMEGWGHRIDMYVRARRRQSPLALLNAVVDGAPDGSDLRWRYACVNEATLPAEIQEIARLTDEEGIDFYVIRTLFREKGDDPHGLPG